MLYFHRLSLLDAHQRFLQNRSKHLYTFLVGGAVRDLLLGITQDPKDIDFTMAGDPIDLYQSFDITDLSSFITEKYGTSTYLFPSSDQAEEGQSITKYELTPLRTEGNYGDFRHPGEIERSNDLILDAQRRDFTINAMYYFSLPTQRKIDLPLQSHPLPATPQPMATLLKILETQGYVYLPDDQLLILQKPEYIHQTFPEAKFDEVFCRYLIETAPLRSSAITSVSQGEETKKSDPVLQFRILIDPTQ